MQWKRLSRRLKRALALKQLRKIDVKEIGLKRRTFCGTRRCRSEIAIEFGTAMTLPARSASANGTAARTDLDECPLLGDGQSIARPAGSRKC
jgi:hypothetical protein